ncbi:alkaline shock response membrane anchor protein AmaP [Thermoflavimicrobium dichotomicum]|uniref:Uncharacterized conserved protein YloU, alkaline shock protein (Asp23) family n=1 Tax=Thermoflavimicrobium dichotomicum TaxID=46223 RepID=A0A1I3QBK3_9BACL|nr:alkaline shock response membrane anchor protein AmaP [Thermoflavimicrobium dichotomicum]SFJ31070.1 Uncharacterized conserved protein YloU, alkaline shock protein (Asp23) family [Thermoflavimicrobium dichotomicum]
MGLWDRLLLFLFSLGVAALAITGILIGCDLFIDPKKASEAILLLDRDVTLNISVVGVSVFVLLISLYFISWGIFRRSANAGVDQLTEIGNIRISLETIENIAVKAARRVKGVRDLSARIRHNIKTSSVDIGLKIIVDGETPIQQVSEQLQRTVKDQVETIAGVAVDQVPVYVAKTIQANRAKIRVE